MAEHVHEADCTYTCGACEQKYCGRCQGQQCPHPERATRPQAEPLSAADEAQIRYVAERFPDGDFGKLLGALDRERDPDDR